MTDETPPELDLAGLEQRKGPVLALVEGGAACFGRGGSNPTAPPPRAGLVVAAGVRLPAMAQRVPRVVVDLALGPVGLAVTVARRKRGPPAIRWPMTADGAAGVVLPPGLLAEAEAAALAAVRGNPAAWAYLAGRGL